MSLSVNATPSPRADRRSSRRKIMMAIGAGQVIEWFDWTLYATFAPFFAAKFFPADVEGMALLAAFAIYAVGFFFRPLGGIWLGHLADRFGRGVIFNLTVLSMAAGSLAIAVLPGFDMIGWAAPILLVLARIVQGLSAGGEMPTATALASEEAVPERRGFQSSIIFVGTGVGVLLASTLGFTLTSALDEEQMATFGWRIAFAVGALIGLYALVLRRSLRLGEDGERSERKSEHKMGGFQSFVALFRESPVGVLRVFAVCIGGTVGFYTLTVYMPTFLIRQSEMTPSQAFLVSSLVLIAYSALPPVAGMLSDRFGRKPVMGTAALLLAILIVPASMLLTGTPTVAFFALLPLLILVTGVHGPLPAFMSEQFPQGVRGLGIGFAYSTATAIFGGTTAFIATWLAGMGQQTWFFAYVAATMLLAAICFFTMPETSQGLRRSASRAVAER